MSGAGPYKSHWKKLVAEQQAAAKKPSQEPARPEAEPETPRNRPEPQDPTPITDQTLYRKYFYRYRYGWLAAVLALQIVCLMLSFGRSDVRPGRQPIYGEVTLRGQAPAYGSISFYPVDGHAGPPANTSIVKGRYQFSKADGPLAGPHHAVLSYVWDAADEAQFQIPGTKGKESSSASEPADDAKPQDEQSQAADPAPQPRSHGYELDVQVPMAGSLRIDFQLPE